MSIRRIAEFVGSIFAIAMIIAEICLLILSIVFFIGQHTDKAVWYLVAAVYLHVAWGKVK